MRSFDPTQSTDRQNRTDERSRKAGGRRTGVARKLDKAFGFKGHPKDRTRLSERRQEK